MLKNAEAKRIHFIGIGGAGMSAIAKVLLEIGYQISGSDLKESRNTLRLSNLGAKVNIGHHPSNVEGADMVVVSSAIPSNNCELRYACENGIPVLRRAEMLAKLSEDKIAIAVAGTHGKTTTTSMISMVFQKNHLDPTFLIGGELNDIGSNAKYGKGDFVVAEADESDGSLLYLKPEIIVLTNIEPDHLDYYQTFDRIQEVFLKFITGLPEEGYGVVCGDHPNVQKLLERTDHKCITYGLREGNDFYVSDIELEKFSSSFQVYKADKKLGKVSLHIPGIHNIYNAMATIALSMSIGLSFEAISDVLSQFKGVQRRYQLVGSQNGITLIDDYAHLPTEVKVTLETAREGDWSRIICLFQPHRFSRTKFLSREFADAFEDADLVILTDVYGAGEEPIPGVSGKLILEAVLQSDPKSQVAYLPTKSEAKRFLASIVEDGDLVLTMGAGDIWIVGQELLESLGQTT
ncbi:MAG: UDP-N-acetylmuramate--L-alanine ligase [Actinomycetota bacterium]